MLGQDVDLVRIVLALGPKFDLGQRLVGEAGRHHEARVAGGIAEVHEAAFRQQNDAVAFREFDQVDLRLHIGPLEILEALDLNLVVEVTDIADDRHVLHHAHMVDGDDVLVAGRGDEDVHIADHVIQADDLEAIHAGLQGADRVDLGDIDAGAGAGERFGRAFANIPVSADDGLLAGHHDIGAATDRVDKAFAAAIAIVEF